MALKIGIVGLPNVGKSTLFKALTKKAVDIANYPFCTIEPNTGIVKVPDSRLESLATFSHSADIIPAVIEFVDIAGLVKGASTGEGLGNKFLSHIRLVDAIAHVTRAFQDSNITHVADKVDPFDDIEVIHLELIFADLATLEKRAATLASQLKAGSDAKVVAALETVNRLRAHLEVGKLANTCELSEEEEISIRDMALLTIKPFVLVINTDEGEVVPESVQQQFRERTGIQNIITLCAKQEADMAELSVEELTELGMTSTGLDRFIRTAYETVGLITYFTTGPQETRAWTVPMGAKAPQAAGVIHTDFEKNFIRAEVVNWQSLCEAGSEVAAKEKGLIRIEGKDYVAQDGDVMVFRHGA